MSDSAHRFIAAAASANRGRAASDGMTLGQSKPLPESANVLNVLIAEAKSFLDAVGPIRNNFGARAKMLENFKIANSISPRDWRRYRDIRDANWELIRKLGPAYHAIMPYVEWDQQSVRDFRAVFSEQEDKPTHVAAEARLKNKIAMIERCAQSVEDLRERLLYKLERIHWAAQVRDAGGAQMAEAASPAEESDAPAPLLEGRETTPNQAAYKKPARPKNLSGWAVATHDGKEWHLYRRAKSSWRQWKVFVPRKGYQTALLALFAKGGGQLEKTEGLKLWKSLYRLREYEKAMTLLEPELSHLARRIRDGIAVDKARIFKSDGKAWRSAVQIGYAVKEDSERAGGNAVWEIKQPHELSAEESIDLLG